MTPGTAGAREALERAEAALVGLLVELEALDDDDAAGADAAVRRWAVGRAAGLVELARSRPPPGPRPAARAPTRPVQAGETPVSLRRRVRAALAEIAAVET